MTKEKIIILDYATGKVYITHYDSNIVEDYGEYYEIINKEFDLNLSDINCSCMIVKGELDIEVL